MMKVYKWVLLAIFLTILMVIGYAYYDAFFSTRADIGIKNWKNAKQLQVGMNKETVISIMGEPDTSWQTSIYGENIVVVYIYQSNNDDRLPIKIYIDTSGKVADVFNPK